ncbi:MAG: hypothetical protein EBW08_01660, partial [Pelagibacteraceae bacterium]|nr:hypothetical protein [Pelagibacteraceae bacterium]
SVYRNDYTNEGVETLLITGITANTSVLSYTFTGATVDCAYNFEYLIYNNSASSDYLLTENSEPILTENNNNLQIE